MSDTTEQKQEPVRIKMDGPTAPKKNTTVNTGQKRSGPRKHTKPDYTDGLTGLLQTVTLPLAIAGMQNQTLAADAVTIDTHGPNVVTALNSLAQERPEVAAILEKMLSVGPYGLLVAAITPMAMQLLVNHNVMKPGMLGTVAKSELVDDYEKQMEDVKDLAEEAVKETAGV